MIAIDHLTKRFGRRTLWEDLCFEVPSGAMHALTGPSGCGKTTLLNFTAPNGIEYALNHVKGNGSRRDIDDISNGSVGPLRSFAFTVCDVK